MFRDDCRRLFPLCEEVSRVERRVGMSLLEPERSYRHLILAYIFECALLFVLIEIILSAI